MGSKNSKTVTINFMWILHLQFHHSVLTNNYWVEFLPPKMPLTLFKTLTPLDDSILRYMIHAYIICKNT